MLKKKVPWSEISKALFVQCGLAQAATETVRRDEQVKQPQNAATTEGEYFDQTAGGAIDVEVVNAQTTEEKPENKVGHAALGGHGDAAVVGLIVNDVNDRDSLHRSLLHLGLLRLVLIHCSNIG